MIKKVFFLLLSLLSAFYSQAQELTVKSMEVAQGDLSASTQPRNDKNGNPCGLVKVRLAVQGAEFDGNIIPPADFKTGEYWVYMTKGSYLLEIKHPDFLPQMVNFRDYSISGVDSKTTYILTMQNLTAQQTTQRLILNYSPATAMVLIDSKPMRGNGRVEKELPIGQHSYLIAAEGFITAEGTVKLNGGAPREITEKLAKDASVGIEQPAQVQSLQPEETSQTQPQPILTSTVNIETFTVNGVSFKMVCVEGGTFTMGATPEQGSDAWDSEKPAHQVTLSTYYIGETEVTQALWEAVMGSNPSKYKGTNRPVESVSWEDICGKDGTGTDPNCFLYKLNKATGRSFRLPTEAEWEFAARGGNKSKGYKYSGSDTADDVAWYYENSGDSRLSDGDWKFKNINKFNLRTHDVKTKKGNELGIYDMSGNVWEWCSDWYGSYSSEAQINPTGPSSGSYRVRRGGSWDDDAGYCRVSDRGSDTPGSRGGSLGLRLAL